MKQLILMFSLLLFLVPIKSYAKESQTSFFSVDLEVSLHDGILPGDHFQDCFLIENHTSESIKVRLYDVSNMDNSPLYSALQASWNTKQEFGDYLPLDNLKTSWIEIAPKATLPLTLSLYFPAQCGNEYQGTSLYANFLFECILPESTGNSSSPSVTIQSSSGSHATQTIPKTGDSQDATLFAVFTLISMGGLIFIRKIKQ